MSEKKKPGDEASAASGGRRTNDSGRLEIGRWGERGGDRAALEGGATIREGRKYIVSICEHRDKTIIL